ncbi:MAG: ribonuclease domain-containing protein [Planctomycetia bacterium]
MSYVQTMIRSKTSIMAVVAMMASAAMASAQGFGDPQISSVRGTLPIIPNVRVVDFGRTIYTGRMDVNPTINRVRQGTKIATNDGSIHQNRERKLPVKTDRQYYREFYHRMSGFPFPGPQRIIIGKAGEVFYTGDHYKTFVRVR